MSIIKHVTLQKIVAHYFRYDPRKYQMKQIQCVWLKRNVCFMLKEVVHIAATVLYKVKLGGHLRAYTLSTPTPTHKTCLVAWLSNCYTQQVEMLKPGQHIMHLHGISIISKLKFYA